MEGTALRVVAAEDTVVYGGVAPGTAGYTTRIVEDEEVPACHIITEPAAVDGGDKLDPLLPDLQCGRNGGVPAVGEEDLRFESGGIEALDDGEGLADIGPGGAVHLVVGDDLRLPVVVACLRYMKAVSRPLVAAGRIGVIGGLEGGARALLLHLNPG
ncbi:MAG: hypothetical protein A4E60_02803 [Syntrophorhabdus sp. PtaB.Bin047]|nr:MAG: hypothetical protein A4E60_02803 [Syntrophorhabdus sp. PtaB.Bin047]